MAGKLSWTDLRHALASRAGVSEKKAGAFLNAIQGQLIEALKSDKQVKINGLGTFKVQAVAPRKSVNVNTGEEILIEGYNKLTFTPEAGVKELVEKSAKGRPEPVVEIEQPKEIDPLKKLGAQAEEIVDILGELGQSPRKVQGDEVQETKEEVKPEPVVEPEPVKEPEPEPAEVQREEVQSTKEPEVVEKPKKEKKYHFVRDTLICVVILLMLLLAGYFFLRHELSDILQKMVQSADTEVVTDTIVQQAEVTEEAIEIADPEPEPEPEPEILTVEEEPVPEAPKKAVSRPNSKYPNLITTEPMHKASRLTWMAKRYYGAKIYWPYLYDANRDVIKNANKIEVGTPIRVPKLTKLQLDTTNAETIATIERLREEALRSGE